MDGWDSLERARSSLIAESAVKDIFIFRSVYGRDGEGEIIESVARAGYMRASCGCFGGPDPGQGVYTEESRGATPKGSGRPQSTWVYRNHIQEFILTFNIFTVLPTFKSP